MKCSRRSFFKFLLHRKGGQQEAVRALPFRGDTFKFGFRGQHSMSSCQFFGGERYRDHFKPGVYVCSQCHHPLFSSRSKFAHSSPWPAFTDTVREDSVTKMMETLTAYKVLCGRCGSGLGHEFLSDGPGEGTSRF
uniref:Methionine sulfoxide reductase B1b n=1 Tax=Kryptolebias marmoratus TaxID=37003 RepID=A0A3Q2ZYX4_KRYMA